MKKIKFLKTSSILFLLIIVLGCSRDDNSHTTDPPDIELINPFAEFSLTISEPSAVAYNSINNSLMIVSDGHPEIFEVKFDGTLISTISTTCSDLEGIALSKNCDTIYVTQEKKKLVTVLDLNGNILYSFSVNVAVSDNSALEGISFNKNNNHLYVINEKEPIMVLEFFNSTEVSRKVVDKTTDISDIFYEESTNSIWIISDESQKILKYTAGGEFIKEWKIPFTKGEGLTIVDGKMYVVNDSNSKLYVFNKPN